MDIVDFYKSNSVPNEFDDVFYLKNNLNLFNFYEPFCSKNSISEREKLYYHYKLYGFQNFFSKDSAISLYESHEYDVDKSRILKLYKDSPPQFKVSYCIAAHNRLNFLKETLSYNLNYLLSDEQIVIADYGSTDGLGEFINENYKNLLETNRIKYIKVFDVTYFNASIAKNIAHYYSDGEYVYNIDADSFLSNQRIILDNQLNISKNNFVIHNSKLQNIDKNYSGILNSFSRLIKKALLSTGLSKEDVLSKNILDGSFGGICMHKNDFLKLGGYNESFMPISYQDSDLLLRCIASNFRYVNQEIYKEPKSHCKSITFSSDYEIFSWQDCFNFNRSVSAYNLAKNNLCATNIKKKFYCETNSRGSMLAHSNTISVDPHMFYISKQINPIFNNLIQDFINYKFDNHFDLADFYIKNISNNLLYENPETITKVTNKLKNNIIDYSINNFEVYKNLTSEQTFDRNFFSNVNTWKSKSIEKSLILRQSTSGSSTGNSLSFLNHKKYFSETQKTFEFDLIRDEFDLNNKKLTILVLINWPLNPKGFPNFFLKRENYSRGNLFNNFNTSNATTYFVNFNGYDNYDYWYSKLLDFFDEKQFDIVLSSGPIINLFTKYIKKHNFNKKFTHLLSNTTEYARQEDLLYLKENNNINYYCDHMRCWDGGATFFTCKHGTHHLNDSASWVTQDESEKLISTDYFNFASPFINYWNGDYCSISNDYKKCECGRFYRPFKMTESRPFHSKGKETILKLREKFKTLDCYNKINQVEFLPAQVSIHCKSKLTEGDKILIREILKEYNVVFIE